MGKPKCGLSSAVEWLSEDIKDSGSFLPSYPQLACGLHFHDGKMAAALLGIMSMLQIQRWNSFPDKIQSAQLNLNFV